MQFQGRIKSIKPVQSGVSASGKEWTKQEFIFEFFENPNDRFPDSVPLSIMNDRIKEYDIHEFDECIIGFGHRTREYQGRWFPDIYIYHFEKVVRREQLNPATAQPSPTDNGQAQQPQQPVQQNLFSQQPQVGQGNPSFAAPTATQEGDDLPF